MGASVILQVLLWLNTWFLTCPHESAKENILVRLLRKTGWILLSALSFLLLGLAFVPVLFPVVLVVAIPLALFMVALLWRARRQGEFERLSSDPTGPVRRIESRILRRSIFAIATSLILYTLLWLHSQFFYIGPLKRDQEPFRQDAIEQFREGQKP
jgi:O-antigen ligase